MLDGLYWEKDYNDHNVSDAELGYVYYESKLLGVPRLRQLRVHNQSCEVSLTLFMETFNFLEIVRDCTAFGLYRVLIW